MAACESCWKRASLRAALLGGSVAEHYADVLREVRADPSLCPEYEQEKK